MRKSLAYITTRAARASVSGASKGPWGVLKAVRRRAPRGDDASAHARTARQNPRLNQQIRS